jgi:hypothetical protein
MSIVYLDCWRRAGKQNGPAMLKHPGPGKTCMRGFTMSSLSRHCVVFTTPTIADVNGDLSPAHLGLADDASAEVASDEAQRAEFECLQHEDDRRCRGCGEPTEGITIIGNHVRACPDRLTGFVQARLAAEITTRKPIESRKFITMYVAR